MHRPMALLTALLVLSVSVSAGADKDAPKVKFEIRLAEKERAEGLEEMDAPQVKEKIYVHKAVVITNADIAEARAHKSELNRPAITVTFVEGSRKKVGEFSEKNIGKICAIFIDGKLVTAPTIRAKFSDKAEIHGDFSREEAERIARGIAGK